MVHEPVEDCSFEPVEPVENRSFEPVIGCSFEPVMESVVCTSQCGVVMVWRENELEGK